MDNRDWESLMIRLAPIGGLVCGVAILALHVLVFWLIFWGK